MPYPKYFMVFITTLHSKYFYLNFTEEETEAWNKAETLINLGYLILDCIASSFINLFISKNLILHNQITFFFRILEITFPLILRKKRQNSNPRQGAMAHACNPNTLEGQDGWII